MNKRARLARRILRDHRNGWPWHMTVVRDDRGHQHWACPHCKDWTRDGWFAHNLEEVPRAYR